MNRYEIALGKKQPIKKINKPKINLDDGYRKKGLYKITKDKDSEFFIIENTVDKLYVIGSSYGFWGYNKEEAIKFSTEKDAYHYWQKEHGLLWSVKIVILSN